MVSNIARISEWERLCFGHFQSFREQEVDDILKSEIGLSVFNPIAFGNSSMIFIMNQSKNGN